MTEKREGARRRVPVSVAGGAPLPKDQSAISPHAPVDPVAEFTQIAAMHGGISDSNGNLTAAEKAATRNAKRRIKKRTPAVIVTRRPDGRRLKLVGAAHERLLDAFGTNSDFFMLRQIHELENMATRLGEEGDRSAAAINSALAMVASIAPTDEIEAALAVQMAGTHALSCEMAARAMRNENIDRMNVYLNVATKLQRTFLAQIEALPACAARGNRPSASNMSPSRLARRRSSATSIIISPIRTLGTLLMSQPPALAGARRCLARTRSANPCQGPAMKNGRCRMHGGRSKGAPKGSQNALKHGFFTRAAIEERRDVAEYLRAARHGLKLI